MKKKFFLGSGLVAALICLCVGFWFLGRQQGQKDSNELKSQQNNMINGIAQQANLEAPTVFDKTSKFANEDTTSTPGIKHVQFDQDENIVYFDNQLIVYTYENLSGEDAKNLAELVDGEIVGDISGSINVLQIQVESSSLSVLREKAVQLMSSENVLYADYDYPISPIVTSADANPWSDNPQKPDSNRNEEDTPSGNDWWAEAIGAYSAWEYSEQCQTVKVGILDEGFDLEHEDLKRHAFMMSGYEENSPDDHGNHVAGLIGAANNTVGIRGISDSSILYCVDWSPTEYECYLSTGEYIEILKEFIEEDIRIINNSWGKLLLSQDGYVKAFDKDAIGLKYWLILCTIKATGTYDQYIRTCEASAKRSGMDCMLMIMELLLNGEDDFLIVQSAGNGYDKSLKKHGVDARYNGAFAAINAELYELLPAATKEKLAQKGITYANIDEKVLIVGAVSDKLVKQNYRMTKFSNFGENVDLCAPGENIYSTITGNAYGYKSGTSMAAPIVTGSAAYLKSLNPELKMDEIRSLLLSSGKTAVGVGKDSGNEYPMLHLGTAVRMMMGAKPNSDVKEGLYIAHGTQDLLFVECDESMVSFMAWWFKLGTLEETVILENKSANFVSDGEGGKSSAGKISFDGMNAKLTLDENRMSYFNEVTEYTWLRTSMWELSDEQLREVAKSLNVPETLEVEIVQSEPNYWDASGIYITEVYVMSDGKSVASASVNSFTGELARNIMAYS